MLFLYPGKYSCRPGSILKKSNEDELIRYIIITTGFHNGERLCV